MAIEHERICGACERACPGWANRCPTCGSLSLLYRITFVPSTSVVPSAVLARNESLASRPSAAGATQSRLEPAAVDLVVKPKPVRKSATRATATAARDTKLRKTPLAGKPESRAV